MPDATSLHVNAVALQLSAYAVTYFLLCQEFCVRAADKATYEPVQFKAHL